MIQSNGASGYALKYTLVSRYVATITTTISWTNLTDMWGPSEGAWPTCESWDHVGNTRDASEMGSVNGEMDFLS